MYGTVALRLSIGIFSDLELQTCSYLMHGWDPDVFAEGSRHLFYELTKSEFTWEVLNQQNLLYRSQHEAWNVCTCFSSLLWSHVRVYLCLWQKSRPGAADNRHGVPVRVKPLQRMLVVLDLEGVDDLENDLPNPEVDGRGVSGRNVSVASKLSSKNLRMFSSSSNIVEESGLALVAWLRFNWFPDSPPSLPSGTEFWNLCSKCCNVCISSEDSGEDLASGSASLMAMYCSLL